MTLRLLNTPKKNVLMLFNRSPPFIQQVGNHAHKGFGLDLASLLQLIQVQPKFKPLGSTQKTYHSYPTTSHVSFPFILMRTVPRHRNVVALIAQLFVTPW